MNVNEAMQQKMGNLLYLSAKHGMRQSRRRPDRLMTHSDYEEDGQEHDRFEAENDRHHDRFGHAGK